jgi:catechol 2,3-dioxygenase-like lactoylglutathione lyase family enzyme
VVAKQLKPVDTFGLTHIAMAVRDPERAARFYQAVVGAQPVYQQQDFIQAQTPGSRDVLVFERRRSRAGRIGGVAHFGFRLKRAADIAVAVHAIVAAGGRVREQGEFVPGEPYVFFTDPDGYEVEIWYELPTPLDPRPTRGRTTRRTPEALTGKAQRPKSNAAWHAAHRMPANATLDQRVQWHQAHEAACACREMPESIRAELARRSGPIRSRRERLKPR